MKDLDTMLDRMGEAVEALRSDIEDVRRKATMNHGRSGAIPAELLSPTTYIARKMLEGLDSGEIGTHCQRLEAVRAMNGRERAMCLEHWDAVNLALKSGRPVSAVAAKVAGLKMPGNYIDDGYGFWICPDTDAGCGVTNF